MANIMFKGTGELLQVAHPCPNLLGVLSSRRFLRKLWDRFGSVLAVWSRRARRRRRCLYTLPHLPPALHPASSSGRSLQELLLLDPERETGALQVEALVFGMIGLRRYALCS